LTTQTNSIEERIQVRPRRGHRRWKIALSVLALLIAVIVWAIRGFGRWLVVSDPLQNARAIVVLAGEVPFRAEEAANVYRQKWAPQVWLTPEPASPELARLGINAEDKTVLCEEVLKKLGVPPDAIRVMPTATHNTEEELTNILKELQRVGGDRLILVTSPFHTRRVQVIWRQLTHNSPRGIVRPAMAEPYDAAHWWRSPDDVKAVGHEFFGLLNAWLGYPVRDWGND